MAVKKTQKGPTKEQITAYIEAVLFKKSTKKAAYLEHINPNISNVPQAISVLEKRTDFKDMYGVLNSDLNLQSQESMLRIQSKYAKMVEKNIDVATDVLDQANDQKQKSSAVRLVNETVGALAIISGNSNPEDKNPKKLDKSGIIVQ